MDGLFAGIMSFGMIGFENLSAYRVGAPLNETPIKVNENMKGRSKIDFAEVMEL